MSAASRLRNLAQWFKVSQAASFSLQSTSPVACTNGRWAAQRHAFAARLLATEAGGSSSTQAGSQPSGSLAGFNAFRFILFGGIGVSALFAYTLFASKHTAQQHPALKTGNSTPPPVPIKKDYNAVRSAISEVLDVENYDDGSYGPVLVRLAWHASGTYDVATNTGGSNGATMRFEPESEFGANKGLKIAREVLDPIKAKFPWMSYADLWTLAGAVAVEEMGGPHIPWRPGRADKVDGSHCPPDGRLPDASQGAAHIRAVFGRMGFTDQEMVALIGAHALGRCHTDRSGFDGPWTNAPTTFSNLYFKELTERKWVKRKWDGPLQYEDKQTRKLMMLPTDMALIQDRGFKQWTYLYAKDEEKFFEDFAAAFAKLLELGVPFAPGTQAV